MALTRVPRRKTRKNVNTHAFDDAQTLAGGPLACVSISVMALTRVASRLVSLHHLPLASVILTTLFLAGSLVVVGIRTHVRFRDNTSGVDDVLMLLGTVCLFLDCFYFFPPLEVCVCGGGGLTWSGSGLFGN